MERQKCVPFCIVIEIHVAVNDVKSLIVDLRTQYWIPFSQLLSYKIYISYCCQQYKRTRKRAGYCCPF
jgi:hypothetical protein